MTESVSLSERNELLYLRERVRELEADNSMLQEKVREMTRQISFLTQEEVDYNDLHGDGGENENTQLYHMLKREFDGKVFLAIEEDGRIRIPETGEEIRGINLLEGYGYEILS